MKPSLNLNRKCTSCQGKGKTYYYENKICKKCGGSGSNKGNRCSNCKGAGIFMRRKRRTCLTCHGTGKKKSLFPKKTVKGFLIRVK